MVRWSSILVVSCLYGQNPSLNFILLGSGSGKDGKKSDNLHGWQSQTVLKTHLVAGRTAWIKLYLNSYNCVIQLVSVPMRFSLRTVKFPSWQREWAISDQRSAVKYLHTTANYNHQHTSAEVFQLKNPLIFLERASLDQVQVSMCGKWWWAWGAPRIIW